MQMCYRGVNYDYNSVVSNLKDEQKAVVNRSLTDARTRQTRFLGQICQKKSFGLAIAAKSIRFMGQISNPDFAPQTTVEALRSDRRLKIG